MLKNRLDKNADRKKAVFLDRDGVIIVDKNFLWEIKQLEFIPRAVEALKAIPTDFLKIIISNQSGIARGYFSAKQAEKFNTALLAELKKKGVIIDGMYYCPHSPENNCECRKPKIGLFESAQRQFNIDYTRSWMIGDKSSDIQAGKNIGAATIQVLTGYAGKEEGSLDVIADQTVGDLYEAVETIKK
ncbi:MAG: HAD family hydrolase [candidate division Zixibacteria bacterium]|nr:HAD family hydrolase [candidate division Zixibacteria bacterium]